MSHSLDLFYKGMETDFVRSWASFSPSESYIFRFFVRGFVPVDEIKGSWKPLVEGLSCAILDDLPEYELLNVSMVQVVAGNQVLVFSRERFTLSEPWQWIPTQGETDYLIDIVVRPTVVPKSWGMDVGVWTHPDAWATRVLQAVTAWQQNSAPKVYTVGVVRLPPEDLKSSDEPAYSWYQGVSAFWQTRQAIYVAKVCDPKAEVKTCCSAMTPYGLKKWQAGLAGEDGLGLASGLADDPSALQPISMNQQASAFEDHLKLPPGSGGGGGGGGSGEGLPKGNNEGLIVMGVFAVAGYMLYQKFMVDK